MRMGGFGWSAVAVLVAVAVMTACTGNDVSQPSSADTRTDVTAGALAVSMAGPSAVAASDLVGAMVGRMGGGTPAVKLTVGAPIAQIALPTSCPATFDLGNGIAGTCSATVEGTATFAFAGTLSIDGVPVSLEGTLVVTLAADQPPSGTRYGIELNATATSTRGAAIWSVTGYVTRDANGEMLDYNLSMALTVTPTGSSSLVVVVVVSPTAFEETITGPRGNTVRFVLDRRTMTGTVLANGAEVALVAITDGCTHVDFVNPNYTDFTICAGT